MRTITTATVLFAAITAHAQEKPAATAVVGPVPALAPEALAPIREKLPKAAVGRAIAQAKTKIAAAPTATQKPVPPPASAVSSVSAQKPPKPAPKSMPPKPASLPPATSPPPPALLPLPPSIPNSPPSSSSGTEFGLPGEREFNECTKIPPNRKIKITLKPESDISDLIAWISSMTCKKFIMGAQVRSQKVTIISPEPVTAAEAYRAFLSAMEVIGLSMEVSGPYLKIIEANQAKASPIPTFGPDEQGTADDQIITQLIRVENVPVSDVQPILGALKSRFGDVQVYAPTNTLIITETGSNLRRLLKVLKELDVGGTGEKVWILRVRYASATDMAERLKEIFQTQQGAGGRPAVRGAAVKSTVPRGKESGGEEGFTEAAPSKIIPDDRTNVLIIVASEKAYVRIAALVKKLDIPVEGGEGRIHVYPLENADAEELSGTLGGLVAGAGAGGAAKRREGAAGGGPGTVALFEGDVKINADKPTNALVIVSSVKDFYALRDVIRKLDIPRRQVFVEATILEVGVDTSRNLGVSWHGAATVGTGDSQSLILGGLKATDTLGAPPADALVGLAAGVRGPVVEGSGNLLGTGVDLPGFGVLLQALQTNNDVNVISSPHLLTMDNVQAEISIGESVPTQGAVGLGNLASLAGAAGGAGAGNLAGLLGGVSVQRMDVALTLKITPHVNDSDMVRLEIDQEVSDIVADNFNGLGPKTAKRQAKTEVVLRDQQTIVIGGLMKNRESISETKVPLLGDIPILGWLFKNRKRTVVKSNLMLVLTPYVIRDQTDLRRIFEKKLQERRDFVERYTAFADYDPEAEVDYRHKRGLLEEINRTARIEEEEALQVSEALRQNMIIEEGAVELPQGFGTAPTAAPAGATGAFGATPPPLPIPMPPAELKPR